LAASALHQQDDEEKDEEEGEEAEGEKAAEGAGAGGGKSEGEGKDKAAGAKKKSGQGGNVGDYDYADEFIDDSGKASTWDCVILCCCRRPGCS
jgi:hypothetical protein